MFYIDTVCRKQMININVVKKEKSINFPLYKDWTFKILNVKENELLFMYTVKESISLSFDLYVFKHIFICTNQ